MGSKLIQHKEIEIGNQVVTPFTIYGITPRKCYVVLKITKQYVYINNDKHEEQRFNVNKFFLAHDFFLLWFLLVLKKLDIDKPET